MKQKKKDISVRTRFSFFINTFILTILCSLISGCATSHQKLTEKWNSTQFVLSNAPVIGELPTQEKIKLGGLSGLVYLGVNEKTKEKKFVAITDRGPNANLLKRRDESDYRRPFVAPKFSPQLVFLETNSAAQTLTITRQLSLAGPNGKLLTGLPVPIKDANGYFEEPVTGTGEPITPDLMGLDTEALSIDEAGNYWVGEEYRPAILSFSTQGRLIRMFVPEGYYSVEDLKQIKKTYGSSAFIRQTLPKEYRHRRVNRGYEGLTVKGNTLIASLQSSLDMPGENIQFTRWTILDTKTEKIREWLYPMSNGKENRIGDLAMAANGNIYVVEQNGKTGPKSMHSIFEVQWPDESKAGPIILKKTLTLDMVANGLDQFEKIEGLAVVPFEQFAVVNDNDFGLTFEGTIGVNAASMPTLTIFTRPSAPPASPEKQ